MAAPTEFPVAAPVRRPPRLRPELARWPEAWARLAFRWQLGAVLGLIFGGFVPVVPAFYRFVQLRAGQPLPDPLLALLPRADVSGLVFGLIYGGSVATLAYLGTRPLLLLRGLWAYLFLQLGRILVLWALALEPPAGLLPLHDPLMDYVFHTAAGPITKDLFFSGHTSVATLLVLACRGRWAQRLLALAALAVGLLVLVQRVHYTYDVLAAPAFAGAAYWLAGRVVGRWRFGGMGD